MTSSDDLETLQGHSLYTLLYQLPIQTYGLKWLKTAEIDVLKGEIAAILKISIFSKLCH